MSRYNSLDMLNLYKLVWGPGIHFGLYLSGSETIEAAAENTKEAIAAAANINAADRILEVGSGEGDTARWLARARGCHVTASNFTQAQLNSGQQLTAKAGLAHLVHHAWADFTKLPFVDTQFTVHMSQEAFVHCTNKAHYFSEAFRVLQPGGRLILSEQTTNRSLCNIDERGRLAKRHGNDDLWNEDDMANAALKAGFTDVKLLDWSPHMAKHFANLVARIDSRRAELRRLLSERLIAENEDIWHWGAQIGQEGKIGWCLLTARKPE